MITNLFQCDLKKTRVKVVRSPKQKGAKDCGVYAIAFATTIAYRVNPSKLN